MAVRKGIRAFIAVDVPDEIAARVLETAGELDKKAVRLVAPEQMHITLFFFEQISEEKAKLVADLLDSIAVSPFEVSLEGIGLFTPRNPHIVYVNIKDDGILSEIYDALKDQIKELGLGVEDRAFTPHLTIGRIKTQSDSVQESIRTFAARHSMQQFGKFTCGSIKLYKSTLTSDGPVHEELSVKKLP